MSWRLACPSCHIALTATGPDARCCPQCGQTFQHKDGIWRLLAEGRQQAFQEFIDRYETVRSGEGRRVQSPEHLRALPFRDLSRRRIYEWSIRSRSFRTLLRRVIASLERSSAGPLQVLDLGSGLGWLAYRLALRGHEVAAVDLLTNDFDGLGVHRHYDRAFLSVQAEFERLPFAAASVDLAVYNASFHYAVDYASTLREALRVLAPGGRVVILDTPLYRDPSSGEAMVREREELFEKRYRLPKDSLRSEGFLTYERLNALEAGLDLRWEIIEPWHGVRWWLKPSLARLRGSREPARFKLIVGHRSGKS